MRKSFILLILATVICSTSLFAQQDKKDAALAPVGALGKVSKGEIKILLNQMESELSKNYALISQQEFIRAQLRVFEELEAEECTEEACIRKIQELLQVDRLFSLQIIREGKLAQITLTLSREDDKIVRTAKCVECDIIQLNEQVSKLVGAVVIADLGAEAAKGGEVGQLLSGIIAREKELKSRRNSKMNRAEKDYFLTVNPFVGNLTETYAIESSTFGLEFSPAFEIGKYSGSFAFGLRFGKASLSYDGDYPENASSFTGGLILFSVEKTEIGIFALWFPSNLLNFSLGYNRGDLKLDGTINDGSGGILKFTGDLEGTNLSIGFGNQWIMDSGNIWQFKWLVYKYLLNFKTNYTVTSNSISGFDFSKFEIFLEDRLYGNFGGIYVVSFLVGYSF